MPASADEAEICYQEGRPGPRNHSSAGEHSRLTIAAAWQN